MENNQKSLGTWFAAGATGGLIGGLIGFMLLGPPGGIVGSVIMGRLLASKVE